jgi:hypothetical protein
MSSRVLVEGLACDDAQDQRADPIVVAREVSGDDLIHRYTALEIGILGEDPRVLALAKALFKTSFEQRVPCVS